MNVLLKEVNDPKIKDVVLTKLDVTKDLSIAKVYFSTYNKSAKEGIEQGLNRSAGFIRHCLIKTLDIRKIPTLRFIYDDSGDYGRKIDTLIKDISHGQE